MVDIQIRGAEKLNRLTRALWAAGEKELRVEMYRGLNRSVKPLSREVKDSTAAFLPGTYAAEISRDLSIKTRRRATGANPAIYLVGTAKKHRIAALDSGRLRHPLFGNRRYWYSQQIRPGFWTRPLEHGAPRIRRELVRVLDDVARKLARRIG